MGFLIIFNYLFLIIYFLLEIGGGGGGAKRPPPPPALPSLAPSVGKELLEVLPTQCTFSVICFGMRRLELSLQALSLFPCCNT